VNNILKTANADDTKLEHEFKNDDFIAKRERNKNKKILFYSILGTSGFLMMVAILSSLYVLMCSKATTQEVAILTIMTTAPIILSLALMRYTYDGSKTELPQPTLMLNIGKEFATVLTSVFKRA